MPTEPETDSPIVYEERVLAYVDVLGWRELIKKSAEDFSVMTTVARAVKSLTDAESALRRFKDRAAQSGKEILASEVTVFSDTVVVSCRPDSTAIEILVSQVQMFCLELLVAGLYTRGAIVRGLLHHKDGVIFGPALVDAYTLESTVAKYPRIIVADSLQPGTLASAFGGTGVLPKRMVLSDLDSLLVLNLFESSPPIDRRFVEGMAELVAKNLAHNFEDAGIRAKLGWLVKFIGRVLDESKTNPGTAPSA